MPITPAPIKSICLLPKLANRVCTVVEWTSRTDKTQSKSTRPIRAQSKSRKLRKRRKGMAAIVPSAAWAMLRPPAKEFVPEQPAKQRGSCLVSAPASRPVRSQPQCRCRQQRNARPEFAPRRARQWICWRRCGSPAQTTLRRPQPAPLPSRAEDYAPGVSSCSRRLPPPAPQCARDSS